MTPNQHTTREGWLVEGISLLTKEFFTSKSPVMLGYKVPEKLQVACGWPKASRRAIGQCWSPSASADETTQMYISPTLEEPLPVLDTLLHEMIHAVVGCEHGHKGPFRTLAKEVGFAGPMKATYAEEGSALEALLKVIVDQLGPYPHAAMKKLDGARTYPYKWARLMSESHPAYTVTISPRHLEAHGRPTDPWGDEMIDFVKGAK